MIQIEEQTWFFWRKIFKDIKILAKLSSLGYTNSYYAGVPRISKNKLPNIKKILLLLQRDLWRCSKCDFEFRGTKRRKFFFGGKKKFGDDFYVQIQNHDIEEEEHLNEVLLELADKHDVKILAQNETFTPKKKMLKFRILLLVSKTEKEFLRLLVKVLGNEKV